MLLLACFPAAALWAGGPTGEARFSKQIPGTDRRAWTSAHATFADQIYFEYRIQAEDGEHSLQVNVYDGEGREVYNAQSTLVVSSGRGDGAISYGFKGNRDAPGTWWYVAALDDKVVVSSSLDVSR
jgi:hypothetical protein